MSTAIPIPMNTPRMHGRTAGVARHRAARDVLRRRPFRRCAGGRIAVCDVRGLVPRVNETFVLKHFPGVAGRPPDTG